MTDETVTAGDAQAIIDTAQSAGDPKPLLIDQPQALIVPEGATVEYPDLRAWRDAPTRITGTYRPATVDAFAAYVTELQGDATTVWVHPTSGAVVGILDDNTADGPGWREHRAELLLATTPEWDYWLAHDGEMQGQEAFAEHIEGGLEEIAQPDGATMLEIAQSFHATSSAAFRQSTRLASGEQRLQYDEEVKAAAGTAGDLTVPTTLKLAISPFVGEEPYAVAARIRFRLNAGRLTLGYRLDRPEAVVRDSLDKVAERLTLEFPHTYMGDPPTGEQ